jgi:hypothetical protein
VAMAATRNPGALTAFKHAVLQDARSDVISSEYDEILQADAQADLERLARLLHLLIPGSSDDR